MLDTSITDFVPPSGDTTGAKDTRNIKVAIERLSRTATDDECGKVFLAGTYWINEPLQFGTSEPQSKTVCLDGINASRIYYKGSYQDQFALTFGGTGRHRISVCRNVAAKHYPTACETVNRHCAEIERIIGEA